MMMSILLPSFVLASLAAASVMAGGAVSRTAKLVPTPQKNIDYRILNGPRTFKCESSTPTRSHGDAYVSQAYVSMIMESTGYLPISPNNGEHHVQTTLLTGTTSYHTDCLDNEEGVMEKVSDGTPVAFVALNTNANAYFSQGDEHIPIVEGQLIQFDGSIEHNTVVESGVVKLLGPFALPSFELVGFESNCEDRSAEECCILDDIAECQLCPEEEGYDADDRMSDYLGRDLSESKFRGSKIRGLMSSKGSKGDSCNFVCTSANSDQPQECATCNGATKKHKEMSPVAPPATAAPIVKNLYPFIAGQLEDVATSFPNRLAAIVNELGGNINGMFAEHEDILNLNERSSLRNYADSVLEEALQVQKAGEEEAQVMTQQDSESHEMEDINEDFRFTLNDPSKLRSLIGPDSVEKIYNAFTASHGDFPVSRIVLRRTSLLGYGKHMQYHNDGDTAVMRIWLNEDDGSVDGGNLVYLNKDGATEILSKPGLAVVHGNKLVHGVTPMNGTRYILLLLGEDREQEEDDVLEDLLSRDPVVNLAEEALVA